MLIYNLTGETTNVLDVADAEIIKDAVSNERLIMLMHDGLHFLLPFEIAQNCMDVLQNQERRDSATTHNTLPPASITLEQCIPIPSRTASILMTLK